MAGFCEAAAPADGGGGSLVDAGGGGDPGDPDADPSGCTSTDSFEDDFSSDAAWELFASSDACDIRFQNGQIVLRNSLGPAIEECAARSRGEYHLTGRTWIQAVVPGSGSPTPGFGIHTGKETLLVRRATDGLELVARDLEGNEAVLDDAPFEVAGHRFWGLRLDRDGTVHFEVSSDSVLWEEIEDYQPLADLTRDCVRYEISIRGSATMTVGVSFDNLNRFPL
jgi:hypothetical protein